MLLRNLEDRDTCLVSGVDSIDWSMIEMTDGDPTRDLSICRTGEPEPSLKLALLHVSKCGLSMEASSVLRSKSKSMS